MTRHPLQQYPEKIHSALSDECCIMHPIEATAATTSHTWNSNPIRFSSNSTHALCDSSELTEGASHDETRFTFPFLIDYYFRPTPFLMADDGWIVGPKHRLFFWVPPASRHPFYSPGTALVLPRGGAELDLSRMVHGQHWQKCRD
ncbi:hypothetical protein DEU56DRAFT_801457 [Suillus clintonianus]|uniref:uncharacterized protein n=1 Tax=Suillus clintonianus TaxID=1904413 RepID=UPI001B85E3D2|nr:uncharacterized protein DEU56DRAFT_801457 [Suillus clintonianus]KAG2139039.1 hypothetical protein DEU56DRAFT_801457 [Suillus clintonianus]